MKIYRQKWAQEYWQLMCKYLHLYALFGWSTNICIKVCSCFEFELFLLCSVDSLTTNKEQKRRLACDIFTTFATHSSLIHDICWAQKGITNSYVFTTFKFQFLTNRTKNCVKNCHVCILFPHSCWQGLWCIFTSVPCNTVVITSLQRSTPKSHIHRNKNKKQCGLKKGLFVCFWWLVCGALSRQSSWDYTPLKRNLLKHKTKRKE